MLYRNPFLGDSGPEQSKVFWAHGLEDGWLKFTQKGIVHCVEMEGIWGTCRFTNGLKKKKRVFKRVKGELGIGANET